MPPMINTTANTPNAMVPLPTPVKARSEAEVPLPEPLAVAGAVVVGAGVVVVGGGTFWPAPATAITGAIGLPEGGSARMPAVGMAEFG